MRRLAIMMTLLFVMAAQAQTAAQVQTNINNYRTYWDTLVARWVAHDSPIPWVTLFNSDPWVTQADYEFVQSERELIYTFYILAADQSLNTAQGILNAGGDPATAQLVINDVPLKISAGLSLCYWVEVVLWDNGYWPVVPQR